jgi:diguanylate cyclase (GGDEF)-like protein
MRFLKALMKRTLYRSITIFILSVAFTVALFSTLVVYSVLTMAANTVPLELQMFKVFTLVFLAPLVGATLVTYILRRKIALAIKLIREEIYRVRSLEDLSRIKFREVDFGFEELNDIRSGLLDLVERLNRIAVDRRAFEMELKLLQRLIITSEVVRDWKKITRSILNSLGEVIRFSYVFLVFLEGERKVAYVFWNTRRDEKVEEFLRKIAGEDLSFEHVNLKIRGREDPRKEGVLRFRRLDKPSMGGALACGMLLTDRLEREEQEVVDNFLSLLAQVVGSLKAIDEFTGKLEYYATRDPLTGLYNQRVFWELLDYEVERAKRHGYRFALLVVDVDNFKVINDTYGHEFGDRVLKEVARVLRDVLRREDIVARYGGDEFTVVLPYSSSEQAFQIAGRIVESLGSITLKSSDNKTVRITVSVGIAVFPDHAQDSKHLFLIADNMMYRAKEEGKNRISAPTDLDMEETARRLGQKSLMIIEAVEKRKVFPVFQPIVDTYTLETHAYEVLMRLEGDERILTAGEFVPLAESIGLIHRLDYIVIEKALAEISESDFEGRVFFNLSPKALILRDFMENLIGIVRDSGVDPDRIVFEITERDTVKNIELLKGFTERLKEEGFHFAIDDFGSGFASFMYLKHFPVDYIKIEGEFIRSLISSKMDRAFVISITAMCESLGIKTIAEFIEDESIFNAVKVIGVDYAQGFYLGKPKQKP